MGRSFIPEWPPACAVREKIIHASSHCLHEFHTMLIVPESAKRHSVGMSRNHYIFVDFESVQDIDLTLIEGKPVTVFFLFGKQQTKVSVEMMMQVHRFRDQVQMIKMERAGKNALDFVLSHQTGIQTAVDPECCIYILSRDTGFDALVAHLARAARCEVFAQIPVLVGDRKLSPPDRLEQVKARLSTMKQGKNDSRPNKRKTLGSKIQEVFQKQLRDEDVKAVITGLERKGWIALMGDKVTYHF